jgi:hypothetical protein
MSDAEFIHAQAAKCRRLAFTLRETDPALPGVLRLAEEFDMKALASLPPRRVTGNEVIPFDLPSEIGPESET